MELQINRVEINQTQYVPTMNKKDMNNKLKQKPHDDFTMEYI